MTFLKKYGLSAISLNMLISVICIQWATLVYGFFHMIKHDTHGKIYLNIQTSMLYSDFAAAAVLISFGVVIGKASPFQLIVMALLEIVLYETNEHIGRHYIKAIDGGDTIFVHIFGAYFGLTVSRVLHKAKASDDHPNQGSDYIHDHLSMIGTLFLWMFWPSFNSAAALPGDPQHRAILNTYFSLCACVVTTFALSAWMNPNKKFVMEHVQNATLAGGVAIGAVADLLVGPWAALTIGSMAGMICVFGFNHITPFLNSKFKIHDTCGVHNLHGLPGVFGALISCIVVAFVSKEKYGESFIEKEFEMTTFDASSQAQHQLVALFVTLLFAIVGGILVGFILKAIGSLQDSNTSKTADVVEMEKQNGSTHELANGINGEKDVSYFDDALFFEIEEGERN